MPDALVPVEGVTIMTRTTLLLALAVLAQGCTVGEESLSENDSADANGFYGLNKPFRNGCDVNASARACGELKGIHPAFACAFRQRIPDALFMVGTGDPPETWVREGWVKVLLDRVPYFNSDRWRIDYIEVWDLPLQEACESDYVLSLAGVFLPTEAACVNDGGYWNGQFCSDIPPAPTEPLPEVPSEPTSPPDVPTDVPPPDVPTDVPQI